MPKLTTASVEKITAKSTRREIPDAACPGLYLIVQPSGVKSFALRFRNSYGRHVKLTLGKLDISGVETSTAPMIGMPLTLIAARQLAMNVHRSRVLGTDVVAERRQEKLERKAGTVNVFSQACLDFTEQYVRRHNRKWQRTSRYLGVVEIDGALTLIAKSLADRWRDRPLGEITSTDIHHVIDEAREKSIPGLERRRDDGPSEAMARAMHDVLSRLFRWLLEKRRIATNPMHGSVRPKVGEDRERVLSDDEVKAFWNACDGMSEPVSQCLKLLLLTGCRREEIGMLRRNEISDDGMITIPASRSKNKKPHIIPLPQLARDILSSVKTDGEQIFCKGRGLAWSRIKAKLDAVLKFDTPWVLHDLRRTVSTGLNSIGIEPQVVEAALNHVSGSKRGVAGVYNRYAYLPEKETALARWADHVTGLVEGKPANVVSIRKGRAA